jgi:hypothetical protein
MQAQADLTLIRARAGLAYLIGREINAEIGRAGRRVGS